MTIHSELFVWAFFFPLDKPDNDHYFFIGVPFYIKEAENDQQGQIGNGDEHANVEEGKKNIVLLNIITYLLYTSVGFYVRYFSFLSLFCT